MVPPPIMAPLQISLECGLRRALGGLTGNSRGSTPSYPTALVGMLSELPKCHLAARRVKVILGETHVRLDARSTPGCRAGLDKEKRHQELVQPLSPGLVGLFGAIARKTFRLPTATSAAKTGDGRKAAPQYARWLQCMERVHLWTRFCGPAPAGPKLESNGADHRKDAHQTA